MKGAEYAKYRVTAQATPALTACLKTSCYFMQFYFS